MSAYRYQRDNAYLHIPQNMFHPNKTFSMKFHQASASSAPSFSRGWTTSSLHVALAWCHPAGRSTNPRDSWLWNPPKQYLVGGAITILKNMSSSMGRMIPYMIIYEMENKVKPPTRYVLFFE